MRYNLTVNKVVNKNHKNKKIIAIILILIALLIVGGYLYHHDNKKVPTTTASNTAKSGKTNKPSISSTQGGVTRNSSGTTGSAASSLPPSSDWVSSTNGDIVLQQPSANSTIQPGDTISGTANVSNVQFILTDNTVGLIAQGTLNVVNGKFSGTLQFTPHSTTGKLEIYYPDPDNGAEEDVIDIGVNYGS